MSNAAILPTLPPSRFAIPGTFDATALPSRSPWGAIQESSRLMWGADQSGSLVPLLWQVHAAGHGGTRIHPTLAKRFLNGIPPQCHANGGGRLWYEEDCESAVPLFIFYCGLSAADCWLLRPGNEYPREKLLESIRRWMPEAAFAVNRLAQAFDNHLANAGFPLRAPLTR